MVVEEKAAGDGIVFDHFFDDVLHLGNSARLAETLRDEPVPIEGGSVEWARKTFLCFVEDFERGERSIVNVTLIPQVQPVP